VGLDFAPSMIEIARQYADDEGVADRWQPSVGREPDECRCRPADHLCGAPRSFDSSCLRRMRPR
jgi:hypothetical protein